MLSVPKEVKRSAKYSKGHFERNNYLKLFLGPKCAQYRVPAKASPGPAARGCKRGRLTTTRGLTSFAFYMKREAPAKHFLLAFLLALVVYLVLYQSIEYRRVRNGPWRVTFTRG